MVYAKNQDQVDPSYLQLKSVKGAKSLVKNLDKNWMNIQDQWIQYHRNNLFTRGTNTNNKIKRHNRTLKTNRLANVRSSCRIC